MASASVSIDVLSALLTKRELFAAMAMQGILSNAENMKNIRRVFSDITADAVVATAAVECADALLAELAKCGAS